MVSRAVTRLQKLGHQVTPTLRALRLFTTMMLDMAPAAKGQTVAHVIGQIGRKVNRLDMMSFELPRLSALRTAEAVSP